MPIATMTETGKRHLYTLGMLHRLADGGFIEPGKLALTPEGWAAFVELEASGYSLSEEELDATSRNIQRLCADAPL